MNRFLTVIMLLLTATAFCGERETIRDAHGKVVGTATTNGNKKQDTKLRMKLFCICNSVEMVYFNTRRFTPDQKTVQFIRDKRTWTILFLS